MLKLLYNQHDKFVMQINISKTEFLVTDTMVEQISYQVDRIKCLGTLVTKGGIDSTDLKKNELNKCGKYWNT